MRGWTQTEVELILCYCFEVLSLIRDTIITIWRHIASFSIHHRQIDVVSIIFRAESMLLLFYRPRNERCISHRNLLVCCYDQRKNMPHRAQAEIEIIGGRHTEAVAILETHVVMTILVPS